MKKPAALSAGLVAVKGAAAPVADMPTRSAAVETPKPKVESVPLNFKLPGDLVREFKVYAATHGMKLNELFEEVFAEYRRQKGDR